jgi:AmmeMemoRadiSam system protein A
MKSDLSGALRCFLLGVARYTIESDLGRKPVEPLMPQSGSSQLKSKRGVFVTLKKTLSGDLRGCIGYPLPHKPLLEAVIDNARAAAFQDPRFTPLTSAECERIRIEISVLSVPKPVSAYDDIIVGRDGIIISSGMNRGLLLPQVPLEQGWNREQFLDYGCLKAGLPLGCWRHRSLEVETFQACVFGEGGAEVDDG